MSDKNNIQLRIMMKLNVSLVSMLVASVLMTSDLVAADTSPKLKGPWFGQQTPHLTPEIFAPEVVSLAGRYEFGINFSPDMSAMYFTVLEEIEGVDTSPEIHYSKVVNGVWQKPKKANFTNGKMDFELVPFTSSKDNKVYFTARKPNSSESGIWYVTSNQNGFSEAVRYEHPLNTGRLSDLNQSLNGDLVFTNMSERKMYMARNDNGKIAKAQPIDIEFGVHGFISPKQDYLLVNARNRDDESRKDSDLFVYFKEKDGSWSKPINLGPEVNTQHSETVARVSPDGKFLFFGRYDEPGEISNLYWVSTQLISKLKDAHFNQSKKSAG